MYIKVIISATENKTINHSKQNSDDFEIQLARKFRKDVLSLYIKISSLGAPVTWVTPYRSFRDYVKVGVSSLIRHCEGWPQSAA